MTLKLKSKYGVVAFSDEQAALLGYTRTPDSWVKVVYKFPLKLKLKSFFYRWHVRLRFGIRSGEMWWCQDEPVGLDQADEFKVPSIGLPPPACGSLWNNPGLMPPPAVGASAEGEASLKRYIEIAEKFQAATTTATSGPGASSGNRQ